MHESPLERVAELTLLLAVIIIAAKIGGEIAERYFKVPTVLGELCAGIAISPFALGGLISLPVIGTLFRVEENSESTLPVAPELFFIAQMAAVILLFEAGLETNRKQFLRYVRPATAVAMGGVIVPFTLGMVATIWLGFANLDSIQGLIPALFVGAIMTATSVGITARVLSDIGKLSTPEGVTVLAGAVVDDVLGIIVLAVIVGIHDEGSVSAGRIAIIFAKAVGFWLGLTIIGSLLSGRISTLISWFKSPGAALAVAIGLAFIVAGVAEVYFGLAMIIGSYSFGLALSNTNLKHRIEVPMRRVNYFLVPLFFAVIGMQVDFTSFFSAHEGHSTLSTILFAVVLSIFAIVSKLVGSGLPALTVGFNRIGSWRIALGMLPRGEVALIVAGIGLASGTIGREVFGVAIVMTVVTTVLAPILLIPAFRGGSGLRSDDRAESEPPASPPQADATIDSRPP